MDKEEWKQYSAQKNEASFLELMREKLNNSAFEYIVSVYFYIVI